MENVSFLSYFPAYPLTCAPSRLAYTYYIYINRGQQAQTQKGTSKQTKSTRACACTFCKLRLSGRQQTVGTQGARPVQHLRPGPVDVVEFIAEELPPEFKERRIQS
jgi:hypothetical protein